METSVDLTLVRKETLRICKEVGRFIRLEQSRLTNAGIDSKGPNDFVTYVDKAAESLLVSELSSLIEHSGFLTEENTVSQEEKPIRWIIDPIDGTTNFIHGLPMYTISIGLEINGVTRMGVVLDVSREEAFHAIHGEPAFMNEKEIKVSNRSTLKESLLVTGFPYKDEGKLTAWLELFRSLLQNSHGLRRLGSAALDLAYVACGRFEAFYEYGLNPWDVSGGAFIVQQAGGAVSDFNGTPDFLHGKSIIAGNGKINDELMRIIQTHFPFETK